MRTNEKLHKSQFFRVIGRNNEVNQSSHTIQLGKDKHKRLKKSVVTHPLFNISINSKIAHKPIGKFTLEDIKFMLKPTGYNATLHFLERIAVKKGTKRWNSIGVYT